MFISTAAAAAAKSLHSCPTLRDPIDSSPPGSPVPGNSQLESSNSWYRQEKKNHQAFRMSMLQIAFSKACRFKHLHTTQMLYSSVW